MLTMTYLIVHRQTHGHNDIQKNQSAYLCHSLRSLGGNAKVSSWTKHLLTCRALLCKNAGPPHKFYETNIIQETKNVTRVGLTVLVVTDLEGHSRSMIFILSERVYATSYRRTIAGRRKNTLM